MTFKVNIPMAGHAKRDFLALNIAVLTVSDTRSFENDTSGALLEERLLTAGHHLAAREICIDDVYQLRAVVSKWIASKDVQVVLVTGGTGFTARDTTPEALTPLFDKSVEGFGELFRSISYQEIGTSTIQSRAIAGMANQTVIFCMPGSTGACTTAWDNILQEQLNAEHRPCNFVMHLKSSEVTPCDSRG
ncbi:MAG: molybdenum cofactor biosynthesis protein B [Enterobacterales bacterium]|jgi:molybdenum cofactor biosynthesis protein B